MTLVWHDAPSSPDAPTALVNDLDLRLQHTASGASWLPWVLNPYPHPDSLHQTATRQPDHLNNVEQVTLQQPDAGTYEVQVQGFAVPQGPQLYSIAYEYTSGLTWSYPSQGSSLKAGHSNRLRWSGVGNGTGELAYKWSGSNDWVPISDNIDLRQPYVDWLAPDTLALVQLRLSTNGQTLLSPEFILAPTTQAAVTLNCGTKVLLQWPQVKHASSYQLYRLDGLYLQPLLTTADTVAVLPKTGQTAGAYFSVAPVVSGVAGERSDAVTFNPQEERCYIYSFLPQQLAMEDRKSVV